MCGICGWFGRRPRGAHEATLRMVEQLRHRGPDDAGIESGEGGFSIHAMRCVRSRGWLLKIG